jgi:hypothetical protein
MGYTGERKKEYQREWIARRREKFFAGKNCVNCGSIDELQLDHIDRQTKVDHKIWSWSKERREAEIEKCQILCYPCHKIKTASELWVGHGREEYRTRKCRCDICRDAQRDYARKWRGSKTTRKNRRSSPPNIDTL